MSTQFQRNNSKKDCPHMGCSPHPAIPRATKDGATTRVGGEETARSGPRLEAGHTHMLQIQIQIQIQIQRKHTVYNVYYTLRSSYCCESF